MSRDFRSEFNREIDRWYRLGPKGITLGAWLGLSGDDLARAAHDDLHLASVWPTRYPHDAAVISGRNAEPVEVLFPAAEQTEPGFKRPSSAPKWEPTHDDIVRPEHAVDDHLRHKPSKDPARKPRFQLVPLDVVELAAVAMGVGDAGGYRPGSWKNADPDEFVGAMFRHLRAMQRGEHFDDEVGEPYRGQVTHAGAFLASALVVAWHYAFGSRKPEGAP